MLDDNSRLRVLAEMGIDVYRLRAGPDSEPALVESREVGQSRPDTPARVVVVSSQGVRAHGRIALLLKHLPGALGISASSLAVIDAGADGQVAALPEAPAYLLLGEACARACAAHLTLAQLNATTLANIAAPDEMLRDAAGKRALWQLLKPLARRLRASRI